MFIFDRKVRDDIDELVRFNAVHKNDGYYLRFVDLIDEVQAHLINDLYDERDPLDESLFRFYENKIQEAIDEACGDIWFCERLDHGFMRYQDRDGEFYDLNLRRAF